MSARRMQACGADGAALIARLVRLLVAQAGLYRAARACAQAGVRAGDRLREPPCELLQEQNVQIQQSVELLLTHCTSIQYEADTACDPATPAALARLHRGLASRARRLLADIDSRVYTGEADLLADIADGHDRAARRLGRVRCGASAP